MTPREPLGPYLFDGGCNDSGPSNPGPNYPSVVVIRVSDIESRETSWLWPGRIPRGMLTMFEGDPGTGKSTLLLDLVARVTRGSRMPDKTGGGSPETVVLLSAEDDPSVTIRPRLEAAGADLGRVVLPNIRTPEGYREPTVTEADVAMLEAVIVEHGASLLVIDPLVAYLPDGVDTNSDHSVRRALVRLKGLAERTGCAVVCVRHWRKGPTENALYRGGGSIAFIAAARAGLVVGYDPDDPARHRRVLAVSKASLSPIAPSLAFTLAPVGGSTVARVQWEGVSPHAANELTREPGKPSKLEAAAAFLADVLSHGEMPASQACELAKDAGIAPATLRRAAVDRVKTQKAGDGSHWIWSLHSQDDQDAHSLKNDHLRGDKMPGSDHLPRGDAYEDDLGVQR